MANIRRRGGGSTLWMARQSKWGTPKKAFTDLINRRFPFTSRGFDGQGNQTDSESITGVGADTKSQLLEVFAEGPIEMELLSDDAIHFLIGIFNPETLPTSVANTGDKELKAANTTAANGAVTFSPSMPQPDFPSQVEITVTGTGGTVKMVVEGYKKTNQEGAYAIPTTDTVEGSLTTATTKLKTKDFFGEVTKVTLTFSDASSKTYGLQYLTGLHKTDIGFHPKLNQFDGWTWLMSTGGVPVVAYDVIPNSSTISMTDGGVRLTMEMIASYAKKFRLLPDDSKKLGFPSSPDLFAKAAYPSAALNYYSPWGTAFRYGDESDDPIIAARSYDLVINHNYENRPGFTGVRTRGRYGSSDDRNVTMSLGTYFETGEEEADVFEIWEDKYVSNETSPLTLTLINILDSGQQTQMKFNIPNAQLNEYPTVTVDGRTDIERDISWKCLPSDGASSPDEVSVEIWSTIPYAES